MTEKIFLIVLAHLIGDYVLQSDFIATTKGENWYHLFVHSILYVVPFYFIFGFNYQLFFLFLSHFVIDAGKAFTYKQLYKCILEPEHYDEDEERYVDYLNDYMEYEIKPDWCPLKKLPEKKPNPNHTRYIDGYNKCLKEIGG